MTCRRSRHVRLEVRQVLPSPSLAVKPKMGQRLASALNLGEVSFWGIN